MQHKKIFLYIMISALLCTSLFAQEQESIKSSADCAIGFNSMQGYEPSPFCIFGNYNVLGKRFEAGAGLKLEKGDTQFTLNGSYRFFKTPQVSLGTGIIYNFDWLHDVSISNNFLPGFYLWWNPCSFYSLQMNIDFFLKLRGVFALHDDLSYLINATMAFCFHNDFYLPHNINLYFEFASIERFRYMILCAPSFIFGGRYAIKDNLDISLEAAIRYIDFFTLSAHYEDTAINLGVRYKW